MSAQPAGKEFDIKAVVAAKEFVPTWMKKPTAAAAPTAGASQPSSAAAATAAPPSSSNPNAQSRPAPPPPPAATKTAVAAAAPSMPPAKSAAPRAAHMNPHALVFEPKFMQSPSGGVKQSPLGAPTSAPPPTNVTQWPAGPKSAMTMPPPVSHILPPSTQPIVTPKSAAPHPQQSTISVTNTATNVSTGLKKLSDAEVLAISKKSSLKVGAAVFLPGKIGHKRDHHHHMLVGKPSPLTLTPASPDAEMLLFDAWCLYCLCSSVTKEEQYDPTLVFRIDSVPTFWKTMNNLPEPTELGPPATMYLFRDDIYPKWEDPKNVKGGIWKVRVDRDKIDAVWLVLTCKTIGESWLKEHRNTINGIVLKVRDKGFYVEIWVTEKREQFPTDLMGALEDQLPTFVIDYYTHEEIQAAMKEMSAVTKNAKGGKKNNKRK